jgi:pantoate kinase
MSEKGIIQALAFAPGHITGFFEICDQPDDILQKGSRGAGVCIAQGIKTRVSIKPTTQNYIEIQINGEKMNSALVSYEVADKFLSKIQKNYNLQVEHETEIPIGCGLGASGAASLSLAIALNKVLKTKKTVVDAAQIAHIAEIKYKTGLGTVLGQTKGGLEIRKEPGGPGFGVIDSLSIKKDYRVVCIIFDKISTKKILINRKIREKINQYGNKALKSFLKRPNINKFMEVSRDFAESVGLLSSRLRKLIDIEDKQGFICSQAMFGETLFSIVKESDVAKLIETFRGAAPVPHWIINAAVDNEGARLL